MVCVWNMSVWNMVFACNVCGVCAMWCVCDVCVWGWYECVVYVVCVWCL